MTRLIFIRHAATEAVGRRIAGRTAVPLNDLGRAQASSQRQRRSSTRSTTAIGSDKISVSYLGVPIDRALRYDVDPASVSVVELGSGGPRVRSLNSTEAILG